MRSRKPWWRGRPSTNRRSSTSRGCRLHRPSKPGCCLLLMAAARARPPLLRTGCREHLRNHDPAAEALGLRWRRCRLALGFFWSGKSAPTSSSPIRAPCENVSSPPGDDVSRPRTHRAPRRAGKSNSTRNPQLRIDGISFVTLSTVAYGDILPLTGLARGLAALEGIVGQFWPYWSPALSDCTLSTVSGEIQDSDKRSRQHYGSVSQWLRSRCSRVESLVTSTAALSPRSF